MSTTVGSNTPKRIHLRGDPQFEEALAGGAITPGMLLAREADGDVIVHATAGGWTEKAFATEDALQGKTVDDAYASGARVSFVICKPGDIVYAWLSGGENADQSEFLTSNGDGTLKVASSTDIRIATPLENVDASDSANVDERIKVRIL